MARTYNIRGKNFTGVEIARVGSMVTLRGTQGGWPFPQERTVDRSELVFMFGDPEPSPEPEREFPAEDEPQDSTGDMFEEGGG